MSFRVPHHENSGVRRVRASPGKYHSGVLNPMTTSFISRLRANDQAAWFELWETFGPVLRAQLTKWGKGRIGPETVRDLSQETLAALSDSIDRYQPEKGARFSTWLLAIAKHVLGDEIDKRNAQKRGGSGAGGASIGARQSSASLDEAWMGVSRAISVDAEYEAAMFRAKVEASIRLVEKESDFLDFSIYRMRVLDAKGGKEVADALGVSEPTISRRLAKVRDVLRLRLQEVIATYSFSREEMAEGERNGVMALPSNPGGAAADAAFDDAVGEIYRRQVMLRNGERF